MTTLTIRQKAISQGVIGETMVNNHVTLDEAYSDEYKTYRLERMVIWGMTQTEAESIIDERTL